MSTIVCRSPIDGRIVAERVTASGAEIEAAIAAARQAQQDWARTPLPQRAAVMSRFLDALKSMNADVTRELALQMGRPVRFGGELRSLTERVEHMVAIAPDALAPIRPRDNRCGVPSPLVGEGQGGGDAASAERFSTVGIPPTPNPSPQGGGGKRGAHPKAHASQLATIAIDQDGIGREIRRVPLGLVLVVAPWNYPYLTAVNTIVPALMAGNAVLLKAASQTILTGERFQQALDAAGLPKGLFRHLVLSHDDTARLIGGGHVQHVAFTGSVEGGRAIERAAAGTFTSIGLELGGKDPAYVRADADLAHAVENLVDGTYFNSGQSCCGIERIYVQESLFDTFVDGFASLTRQYVLDDPLEEKTTLGPMAAKRFADLVRAHTAEAVGKGARALIDLKTFKRHSDETAWLAPQVLTNVDHGMRVMMEESFGPVVGIMKVKDDAEAIRLMNDSPYGLTASIWTRDLDRAAELGGEIATGTVFANRCDYLDPALAWTGVKDTGRGASLSMLGYAALTRPQSFHLRRL